MLHLHERLDYGRATDRIEMRSKKPSTWWDLNPVPLCHETCALPLCYNRCPSFLNLKTLLIDKIVPGQSVLKSEYETTYPESGANLPSDLFF